jgi:hypothetical protein
MTVNGETRLLPVLGDPVKQVRAPLVWTELFRANGVNAACLPIHVAPADLAGLVTAMRGVRNLIGLIVTVPHKPAAAVLAARLLPRAERIGAVNVLRLEEDGSWTGDMLDGEGFVRGLRRAGQRLEGRRALILGAGGVGAAIASSLAGADVAAIGVARAAAGRGDRRGRRRGPCVVRLRPAGERDAARPASGRPPSFRTRADDAWHDCRRRRDGPHDLPPRFLGTGRRMLCPSGNGADGRAAPGYGGVLPPAPW